MALFAVRALIVEIFNDGDIAIWIAENRDVFVIEDIGDSRHTLGEALAARNGNCCGTGCSCCQHLTTIDH